MSTSSIPSCSTSDYGNGGKHQQDSLGKCLGKADEIDYQKLAEQGVQRRKLALPNFSDQQILFSTRILVIALVDPYTSSNYPKYLGLSAAVRAHKRRRFAKKILSTLQFSVEH